MAKLSQEAKNRKIKNYLKNKLLVPIGNDNVDYFHLLNKYKSYVGGVYIGFPDILSGREQVNVSFKFFDKIYEWCIKNEKVFDVVLNSPRLGVSQYSFADLAQGLAPYKNELTEVTFYSLMVAKKKIFKDFKKNISVLADIGSMQQIHALKKQWPDINGIVLDPDINRSSQLINEMTDYATKNKIKIDMLINEGCLPFCSHAKEHITHITASEKSERAEQFSEVTEVCAKRFYEDPVSLLQSPFLTREALLAYRCRFFKICDRTMPPVLLKKILDYYIFGKSVDVGLAFSVVKSITGITVDMLPDSFHERITLCKNECYKCSFCQKTYSQIIKNKKRVFKNKF